MRPHLRPLPFHYGRVITAAAFIIGITACGVYYAFALFDSFILV